MQITLNYEAMPERARAFAQQATAMKQVVGDTTKALAAVTESFTGATAASLAARQSAWATQVTALADYLVHMDECLETIASSFQGHETTLANTLD
ncbi:MAG: WXG100 family type VII secretion target [Propionibacteriaceae bacterium]|nr:WXG100 family type VII secretion target [Propionibacteriaceae bacterium]